MPTNQEVILQNIATEQESINNTISNCFSKIVKVDSEKEPYQRAINALDTLNFDTLDRINVAINSVRDAYQDRIDAGCRSDLLWRVTGITTDPDGDITYDLKCVRISGGGIGTSKSYDEQSSIGSGTVGITTDSLTIVDQDAGGGITSFPRDTKLGIITDFYHGLKIYDEPYFEDLLDTYVAGAIGTCGFNTTFVTFFQPTGISSDQVAITTGMRLTSDKNGLFPSVSETNEIVGIGTTTISLIDFALSESEKDKKSVFVLELKDATIGIASAPNDEDGNYVTFNVIRNPLDFDDINFGLPIDTPAYTPQTIKMMTRQTIGMGVRVEKDNSGKPNKTEQWNQFLEGLVDPYNDPLDIEVVVVEPDVGAGRVHYKEGFTVKPVLSAGGSNASEGDTLNVDESLIGNLYDDCGTCPEEEAALTAAISSLNTLETALENDAVFTRRLNFSNALRKQLEQFNLRIFAYRIQTGDGNVRNVGIQSFRELINDTEFLEELNSQSDPDVLSDADPFDPEGKFKIGSLGIVENP